MVRRVALVVLALGLGGPMAGCNSNPPPRPMPQPMTQSTSQSMPQQATPRSQQAQTQEQPAEREAQTTRTAERPSDAPAAARSAEPPATPATPVVVQSDEPGWYRPGVFELEGVEHRAFAVTAADVREARSEAMRLAYDAYPRGQVAAHEAVRLADGSWRFYVLMAAGG